MLLIPIVALKLASMGWRAFRYCRCAAHCVRRGPPHVVKGDSRPRASGQVAGQLFQQLARLGLCLALVGATVAAGAAVAVATLPAADRLQDAVSGSIALDAR